ncbi:MAG: hypothetical protein ABL925_21155, partial [Methylococcales bacterium]
DSKVVSASGVKLLGGITKSPTIMSVTGSGLFGNTNFSDLHQGGSDTKTDTDTDTQTTAGSSSAVTHIGVSAISNGTFDPNGLNCENAGGCAYNPGSGIRKSWRQLR